MVQASLAHLLEKKGDICFEKNDFLYAVDVYLLGAFEFFENDDQPSALRCLKKISEDVTKHVTEGLSNRLHFVDGFIFLLENKKDLITLQHQYAIISNLFLFQNKKQKLQNFVLESFQQTADELIHNVASNIEAYIDVLNYGSVRGNNELHESYKMLGFMYYEIDDIAGCIRVLGKKLHLTSNSRTFALYSGMRKVIRKESLTYCEYSALRNATFDRRLECKLTVSLRKYLSTNYMRHLWTDCICGEPFPG